MPVIDIIGWLGSALIVIAYTLNMMGKMKADSFLYIILNIVGSAALIANTLFHDALPSTALNVVWIIIAIVALFRKPKKIASQ